MTDLDHLLESLQVPAEYSHYASISDATTLTRLASWKAKTQHTLVNLQNFRDEMSTLPSEHQARVVSALARFVGHGAWISSESSLSSQKILQLFDDPTDTLLRDVLTYHVKPIFKANPHPNLNLETGRKLSRPAGGPMFSVDYYDGQQWKGIPGAAQLVLWCVCHMKSASYDELWPLIIPPIMTLVDDYETAHKLRGIEIVAEMLKTVPAQLLKRTGVDSLLFSSLNTAINQLKSPESPELLRTTVRTLVKLIDLTTVVGTSQRFEQTCTVLGDGIIGGVWVYASEEEPIMLASVEVLPTILSQLGLGCTRYLKAMIPLLIAQLKNCQPATDDLPMCHACSRCLIAVITHAAPRMHAWKSVILDGIARCWVTISESKERHYDARIQLQSICSTLAEACPSVVEHEYVLLQQLDSALFSELLVIPLSVDV